MAVVMRRTLPEGVPIEMLDAVTAEMNVKADPPAGMIVHVHFEEDSRVQVIDIWDSPEAYETFARDRLRPAMEKVAAAQGMELPEGPGDPEEFVTVRTVVRGA